MTLPEPAVVDALRAALDPHAVLTGADTESFAKDGRGRRIADEFVLVRPADVDGIAAAVRVCADHDVAIVPMGGHTGLSHGTLVPNDRPSIVLSTSRLDRILSVDPDRWTITAEAGVGIEAVQEAARAVGRAFAPDWGARGTATVGGAISTDAGGNNVLRYGNMREHVLGIEAVLADGTVWDGRRALRKDSSGYDLKQLFIGGEGTLGIVTSAVLRLVPATPYETSMMAAITGLDDLLPLLALAHEHAPGVVTAFELVPDIAMERVKEVFGLSKPIDAGTEYSVLVKLASAVPVDDALAAFLEAAVGAGHVVDAAVAGTPEQERHLWEIRDLIPPTAAFSAHQHLGLKLDTAVPLDHIAAFVQGVLDDAARIAPTALGYGFGHVGDGNLHMMILPGSEAEVDGWLAVRDEMADAIDRRVFELGGTLSAEHGIGTLLRDRIRPQKPAIEWELMRAVKRAIDPDDRFNPGKMLPLP